MQLPNTNATAARLSSEWKADVRPRILLVGGAGQLGCELSRSLTRLGEVVVTFRLNTARSNTCHSGHAHSGNAFVVLDLEQPEHIREVVRQVCPDVIVNAAAYTAVDRGEQESERAWAVNAVAPGILAEEARRLRAALVHFSTDYVFDGSGHRPWTESDPVGPLNVYGRSKEAGERAIRQTHAAHLILRTSWVYGVHGENFVKKMLRLEGQRPTLRVVNDQFGAPTSARVLADVAAQILPSFLNEPARNQQALNQQTLGGTFHICCQGETTWHAFAVEIFRLVRQFGFTWQLPEIQAVSTSAYQAPARRPLNSRLDGTKLKQVFGVTMPDWHAPLRQCLTELLMAQPLQFITAERDPPAAVDEIRRAG